MKNLSQRTSELNQPTEPVTNNMKKSFLKLSLLVLGAALLGTPAVTRAQDATNTPSATAPKHHAKGLPLVGKVAAVDTTANTVTVGKQVLTITDKTKIKKAGAAATLADITMGDTVHGYYKKNDDGTLTLLSLTVGAPKKKADAAAPAAAAPANN